MAPPTCDAVPAAITVPPLSRNLRYVAGVGFAPAPGVQAGARSGSFEPGRAPAPPAPPAPPRPPPPNPRPPAAAPLGAPSGSTTTSYFERASAASSVPPQTTSYGNSNRSSTNRLQPDGIEPVGLSHSAILCCFTWNASTVGFALPSASTPSSVAAVLMMAVVVGFATTKNEP